MIHWQSIFGLFLCIVLTGVHVTTMAGNWKLSEDNSRIFCFSHMTECCQKWLLIKLFKIAQQKKVNNDGAKFIKSTNKNGENIDDSIQNNWFSGEKKIARNHVLIFLGRPLRSNNVRFFQERNAKHSSFFQSLCTMSFAWFSQKRFANIVQSRCPVTSAYYHFFFQSSLSCWRGLNPGLRSTLIVGFTNERAIKNTPSRFSIPRWKHKCK